MHAGSRRTAKINITSTEC